MTTPHDHDDFENGLGDRLRALGDGMHVDGASVLADGRERARELSGRRRTGVLLVAASVAAALAGAVLVLPRLDGPELDPIAPVDAIPTPLPSPSIEPLPDGVTPIPNGVTPMPMPEVEIVEPAQPEASPQPPGVGTWETISPGPIPDPRIAVWTGEELLVGGWCGEVGCGPVSSLAAYDPSSDSWTELAAKPDEWRGAQRESVWTGTELVVIGGQTTSEDVDAEIEPTLDGHAYDPATDSWRAVPEAPLSPRWGHSVTWTGTEVIVFGGYYYDRARAYWAEEDTPVTMFSDGAAWNPTTNAWRTIAATPLAARAEHGAHWTGERLLIAAGGTTEQFYPEFSWPNRPTTAALYDPATDTWSDVTDLDVGGPPAASAWTGTELVLWNGSTENWPAYDDQGAVEMYGVVWDPTTSTVEPLPVPPVSVEREGSAPHTWAAEINALVTWGGGCGEGCNANHGDGAFYSPEAGWSRLAESPMGPRRGALTAWTGTELLVVGGYQYDVLDPSVPSGLRADGARWRP